MPASNAASLPASERLIRIERLWGVKVSNGEEKFKVTVEEVDRLHRTLIGVVANALVHKRPYDAGSRVRIGFDFVLEAQSLEERVEEQSHYFAAMMGKPVTPQLKRRVKQTLAKLPDPLILQRHPLAAAVDRALAS